MMMNNIRTKLRILVMWLVIASPLAVWAQTLTDTVPYCCNFENAAERAYWRFANTQTSNGNRWFIGQATQNGVGFYSLYVTNDNASHNYSTVISYSYAYRKLHFPSGGIYEVSYDWESQGYVSGSTAYAYVRAFLISASVTFTGGSNYSGLTQTAVPAGAIAVDGGSGLYGHNSWQTYTNPLVQVPNAGDYYLVFYWYNSSTTATQPPGAIDNICVEPVSCPQPINLTKNTIGGGCVALNWTDYGSPQPTGWIIEYGQYGFTAGTGTKKHVTSKPDTICGLQDDVTYDFMVRAICANGDTSKLSERIHVRYCSQIPGCIDFTNLTSPNVRCCYGTFNNYGNYTSSYPGPWANQGVLSGGGSTDFSQSARHVVCTDPTQTDPQSGNQLMCVPPTSCSSVRLGTKTGSYLCQGIEYRWQVDTNVADIMLLQYANVFYNPSGHPANQQPRFVLQILNAQQTPISATCGQADFNSGDAASQVGNPLTGWHNGYAAGWYWKDWTPVGVDISPYHGQTLLVRLSSFACGQGASEHSGYAYFTLACSKARLTANTCSEGVDTMQLSAPAGFNYRWYSANNPNQTLSRGRTITVNLDSSTYYCDVSFIEDSNCKFTLQTLAVPRFPHSKFSASIDTANCQFKVNVNNLSFTSPNRQDTNTRLGLCESFYWDWGDGTTSRLENPGSHSYRTYGTYTIMLVSSIAEGNCSDTSYQTITFSAPMELGISGDSVVCINTRAHIQVDGATARRFQWSNGATTREIDIYPPDSTTVTVHVWDQLGCETYLTFHVDVDTVPLPIFDPPVYESCVPYTMSVVDINTESQSNTYSWDWGDGSTTPNNNTPTHTYSDAGTYRFTTYIVSAEGCLDTVYNTAYVYGFPHGSFSWTPPIITVTDPEVQFINLTTPNAPTNVYDWEVFYHTSNPVRYENTFEPSHRWTGSTTEFSGSNLVRLITTNQVQTQSGGFVACVDTVENTVLIINDLLQFPNTVTPNGDGKNDIFEIKNLIDGGGFTDNELYVYNHWGRKVYYKKNITSREDFWDPAANNDPDGTYYYRFSAKGYLGDVMRNGTITVVR